MAQNQKQSNASAQQQAAQPQSPQDWKMMAVYIGAGALVVGVVIGILLFKLLSGGSTPTSQQQLPPMSGGMPGGIPGAPINPATGQPMVDNSENIKRLKAALQADPANYNGWVELGNAHFDGAQPQPAIEAYEKALAINDKDPNVITDLGIMYRETGNFTKAAELFRKAMAINPNHPQSRLNLGIVLADDLKDTKGAITAWEDFLRLQPTGQMADNIRQQLARIKAQPGMAEAPVTAPGGGTKK